MEFIAKNFSELSTTELYEIIKSRAEVFLLEQNIVCQDLDNIDYKSTHCFLWENSRVMAYLRAFDTKKDTVQIGRVLTLYHKKGHGSILMNKTIQFLSEKYGIKKITLNSQKHAVGFYEKLGFSITSDEFLEEGVPHFSMELTL